MLLAACVYAASGRHDQTQVGPVAGKWQHPDPHLNYYEEHLRELESANRRKSSSMTTR